MLTLRDTVVSLAGPEGVHMYARLVSFAIQSGKESLATDLARDLVPDIRQQLGCQAGTCFGDSQTGQYYLYVLWGSQEEANAAASDMAPKLQRHLAGNTVGPPERLLYPVIRILVRHPAPGHPQGPMSCGPAAAN